MGLEVEGVGEFDMMEFDDMSWWFWIGLVFVFFVFILEMGGYFFGFRVYVIVLLDVFLWI